MDYQKICDRLADEIRTAKNGKTAVTILPTEHAEAILEIMKKQVPQRPIVTEHESVFKGVCFNRHIDCPRCGKGLYGGSGFMNYCVTCGQAIEEI